MGFTGWLRVLDRASGIADAFAGRGRRDAGGETPAAVAGGGGPLGQLEVRLAGVVVAALKEAFDRDRARLDLEQAHLAAERQRAETALNAELRRQAADRALHHLRLIAIMAIGVWMLSAALAIFLPGLRDGLPRVCLGLGWAFAIASLGGAFAGSQHVAAWSGADATGRPELVAPRHVAASAAPWLLLGALTLTGVSLLIAL